LTNPNPNIEPLHDYQPRWYQQNFEQAMFGGKRRAFLLYHRRAGKDFSCWMFMLYCAMRDVPGIYYYIFPTYSQGKKAIWDAIDENGRSFLSYIPKECLEGKPNSTEMKVKVKTTNGAFSLIQIIGSDNPDAIRGTNPKGVVFSEYALQDPRIWTEIISPILIKNKGWAVFNTTPYGKNHAYDLWVSALHQYKSDWFTQKLTIDDTKLFTIEDVLKDNPNTSEDIIQQEYYVSWDRGVDGSFYGKHMADARKSGRIGNVQWEPRSNVDTYWDIGYGDSTAIIFGQQVGAEFRIIDYYEAHGEGLEHYVKHLKSKPYIYGNHYMPHDAGSGSIQTGMSLQRYAQDLGLKAIILPRELNIEPGIEATRSMLATAWIDETRCKQLIKCLEAYHKKYNDKFNCYSNTPEHDWSSHGCFTGDTKILTRNGMYPIMDLPQNGEILTLCGWKPYTLPRITRKNAQLVKVTFADGNSVKCTQDHMFLTVNGWKYAKDLTKYTEILSSLTSLHNTLMADYIENGQESPILPEVAKNYIATLGKSPSDLFRQNVIFTIKMATRQTIISKIWNAWTQTNIYLKKGVNKIAKLVTWLESVPLNGIDHPKVVYGIQGMPSNLKVGLNGNTKTNLVNGVERNSKHLSEKMDTNINIAIPTAKPLFIESVQELNEKADVWCLTVKGYKHFTLENGAVVHNSDATRYCAMARIQYGRGPGSLSPEKIKEWREKHMGY
jgi:phage terminase large subunit